VVKGTEDTQKVSWHEFWVMPWVPQILIHGTHSTFVSQASSFLTQVWYLGGLNIQRKLNIFIANYYNKYCQTLSFSIVPCPCVQLKPLQCEQQNGHDHPFLATSSESLPPPSTLTCASLFTAMCSKVESSKTN
jgi:hypothetical protein